MIAAERWGPYDVHYHLHVFQSFIIFMLTALELPFTPRYQYVHVQQNWLVYVNLCAIASFKVITMTSQKADLGYIKYL